MQKAFIIVFVCYTMEKARWNYWVDIALLIAFIILAVSGLVLFFAFTSGSPGVGRSVTFMGTSKGDWQPWHSYAGLSMVILVLVHLILNFGFLTSMTKIIFKKKEEVVALVEKSVSKV
jgi:quinol-cytochrome oxidoreductase complex cytochrome b subunit